MKYLVLLLLLLPLWACEDTTGKLLKPDPPIPVNPLFDISVGKRWTFENESNKSDQATIRAYHLDSAQWALRYYDTANKITLNCYFLEFKYFDKGFPRYIDYSIAKIGDSLLFGTRSHGLVAPDYPTGFFVKLFTIPANPLNDMTEIDSLGKVVLGGLRYWKSKAVWTETSGFYPSDTIRLPVWQVKYLAEQKTPVVSIAGDEYAFMKNIGFYKIRNYKLVGYTTP